MTSAGWAALHALPFPEPTEEQLQAICERHGLRADGGFGRLASTGVINTIVTIGHDLLLRLPKDAPEGWSDTLTESVAVPAAMAAGVRTPALVAFDEACDLVAVPYGIYEWIHAPHGEPTTDEGWRDLGRDLARLHGGVDPAACPDPLGRLDAPGRWCSADDVLAALPGLDEDDVARLGKVLRQLEPAVQAWEAGGVRRFVHDDVKGTNLLVGSAGGYEALIDWGDAGWSDPTIDLRTLPPERVPSLLEGYREVHPLDDEATFLDRVRWDQLGAAARRLDEPEQRRRFQALLG